MKVFVDTSALFAMLDESQQERARALDWFEQASADDELVTHNYVVVETVALTHRRLSPEAVRLLLEDVLPLITVEWIDPEVHQRATSAFLAALRRRPSLVDWASFEFMRDRAIEQAFAFDRDFGRAGFTTVP